MKNNIRWNVPIKGMAQEELSIKVSVGRQTIESNKYVPFTVLALKIARVFKKPVKTFSFPKRKIKQKIFLLAKIKFSCTRFTSVFRFSKKNI